jgi:hypothetical protein
MEYSVAALRDHSLQGILAGSHQKAEEGGNRKSRKRMEDNGLRGHPFTDSRGDFLDDAVNDFEQGSDGWDPILRQEILERGQFLPKPGILVVDRSDALPSSFGRLGILRLQQGVLDDAAQFSLTHHDPALDIGDLCPEGFDRTNLTGGSTEPAGLRVELPQQRMNPKESFEIDDLKFVGFQPHRDQSVKKSDNCKKCRNRVIPGSPGSHETWG